MATIIAQILGPHVRRFGGELAVHDAGLRALASSLVPDPRYEESLVMLCDRWLVFLRSGAGSGNRSEDLRFHKVLCCVFFYNVSTELNTKLAGLAQYSGQEA